MRFSKVTVGGLTIKITFDMINSLKADLTSRCLQWHVLRRYTGKCIITTSELANMKLYTTLSTGQKLVLYTPACNTLLDTQILLYINARSVDMVQRCCS